MAEAYRFLQRQGAINFGLLRGDPRVPLPAEVVATMPPPAGEEAGGTAVVGDEEVAEKLYDIMAAADMNVRGAELSWAGWGWAVLAWADPGGAGLMGAGLVALLLINGDVGKKEEGRSSSGLGQHMRGSARKKLQRAYRSQLLPAHSPLARFCLLLLPPAPAAADH